MVERSPCSTLHGGGLHAESPHSADQQAQPGVGAGARGTALPGERRSCERARARAQVRALRALAGMTALLAQRFGAARDLDADLAALQRGDLPPDEQLAIMLVAAKQRVLNAAAHELARALRARAAPAALPHARTLEGRRPAAGWALPAACWRARARPPPRAPGLRAQAARRAARQRPRPRGGRARRAWRERADTALGQALLWVLAHALT